MAGMIYSVNVPEVSLSAATAKTILIISPDDNYRVLIKRWGVFFKGTSATNAPVKVSLIRFETVGGSQTAVPATGLATYSEIPAVGVYTTDTEPTYGDAVVDIAEVHPQTSYEVILPLGDEIVIPGGTNVGLVCTAPDAVTVTAKIWYEV
jgi:hypothetical protein